MVAYISFPVLLYFVYFFRDTGIFFLYLMFHVNPVLKLVLLKSVPANLTWNLFSGLNI